MFGSGGGVIRIFDLRPKSSAVENRATWPWLRNAQLLPINNVRVLQYSKYPAEEFSRGSGDARFTENRVSSLHYMLSRMN